MQKVIFVSITLILIIAVGAFLIYQKNNSTPQKTLISSQTNQITPPPSIIPFYEITIPGLRQREYQSALGELQVQSDSGSYISYLTSYQSDGLKINGLLTRPNGQQPTNGWPAIIFVHGYIPPNQYRTTEKYTDYIDFLARNGFVVFKIDLRGHGDSDGEAGGAYYSQDYVIDTLNARAALQSTNFVDKDNIGLWGHSMAGNVTLRAMAVKPEIPALVVWAGAGFTYLDLASYGIQDASYQPQPNASQQNSKRQKLRELHGNPTLNHPFWDIMVPTNFLQDFKGSISLHHAINDEVVSVNYSRNLNKILDQSNVTHEFYEYPSGGHNLTGNAFVQAMQRTVNFFKSQLIN